MCKITIIRSACRNLSDNPLTLHPRRTLRNKIHMCGSNGWTKFNWPLVIVTCWKAVSWKQFGHWCEYCGDIECGGWRKAGLGRVHLSTSAERGVVRLSVIKTLLYCDYNGEHSGRWWWDEADKALRPRPAVGTNKAAGAQERHGGLCQQWNGLMEWFAK